MHDFDLDGHKCVVYKFNVEPGLRILQKLQTYFGSAIGGVLSGLSVSGGSALLDSNIAFDGEGFQHALEELSNTIAEPDTLALVREVIKESHMTIDGADVAATFDVTLSKFDDPYGALLKATFEALRFNYAGFFKRFGVTKELLTKFSAGITASVNDLSVNSDAIQSQASSRTEDTPTSAAR